MMYGLAKNRAPDQTDLIALVTAVPRRRLMYMVEVPVRTNYQNSPHQRPASPAWCRKPPSEPDCPTPDSGVGQNADVSTDSPHTRRAGIRCGTERRRRHRFAPHPRELASGVGQNADVSTDSPHTRANSHPVWDRTPA
jgi:hypothetical protein